MRKATITKKYLINCLKKYLVFIDQSLSATLLNMHEHRPNRSI
ncbi:hypothetical protein P7I28_02595 [Enterococcus casseliflavus]|nr:hypothetical protein [Enterococcus casseliflavus]MDT2988348.1 hypothetical protein [Enterococcus casseliflavus]